MGFDNKDLEKFKESSEQYIDYLNNERTKKLEKINEIGEEDLEQKNKLNAEIKEINKRLDEEILQLGRLNKQNKDLYNTNESILSNLIKQTQELTKQETKIDSFWRGSEAFLNATRRSFNTFKDINGLIMPSSFLEAARDAAKSLREMETSAQKLGMRAGQGVEGVKELNSAYVDLQKNLKDSAKNSKEIVETLSQTGYVENIKEAAEGVSLFDRATGASAGNTIDMMNALTKVGRMSSKESNNVLANIASIQKKNGLTKSGIDAVMKSTKGATDNMKLFGKSDMGPMIQSMTKLAASVEKVGISADKALNEIEKLTDPERIEENIPKFAALGISINDALTGNMDNIGDQYLEGMKEFGAKLKEMGPIAGAQYAKAFGISYKDALKSLDAQESLEGDVEEDKSLKALVDMKEATLSLSASMQESINGLVGGLKGFSSTMLTNFSVLFAGLSSAITGSSYQLRHELNKIFEKESPVQKAAKNIADSQKVMSKYFAEGEKGLEDYVNQSEKRLNDLEEAIDRAREAANTQSDKKLKKQSEKQIKYLQQIYQEAKKENDKLKEEASALLGKNSDVAKKSAQTLADALSWASEKIRTVKNDLDNLQKDTNQAYTESINSAKKDLESLKGMCNIDIDITNETSGKIGEIKKELKSLSEEVKIRINTENAKNDLKSLKHNFENLSEIDTSSLNTLQDKLNNLAKGGLTEEFKTQLGELQNKLKDLKDSNLDLNTEEAKNKINEIKNRIETLSQTEIKSVVFDDLNKKIEALPAGVEENVKKCIQQTANDIQAGNDLLKEVLESNKADLTDIRTKSEELKNNIGSIREQSEQIYIKAAEDLGIKVKEGENVQESLMQGLKEHITNLNDLNDNNVENLNNVLKQMKDNEVIGDEQLNELKNLLETQNQKLKNAATTVVNGEANETAKRKIHNDENLSRQQLIENTRNMNETKRDTRKTLRENLRDMKKSLENNKLILAFKTATMSFGGIGSILSSIVSFLASFAIQKYQENKMKTEMEKDTQNALSENTAALEKNTNKDETNRGPEKVFISDTGRVKYSGNITQDTKKETSTTNTPSASVNTTTKQDAADKAKVSTLSSMNSTLSGIFALMSNFNKNLEKLGDGLEKLAERTAANIQNVVNYNQTSNNGNNTGENITEAKGINSSGSVMQN